MGILSGYLLPHPAIMVEEVGGKETRKVISSVEAADEVGKEIKKLSPDSIVIISPHGPVFYDAICIYDFPLKGDLAAFGAPQIKMEFARDDDLKNEILKKAKQHDIPVTTSSEARSSRHGEELDHGVTVPMNFVVKHTEDFRLLPIAFGMLPYEDLYTFGRLIKESAESLGKKTIVIASGDLSHRLIPSAPAGYDPSGKIFDDKLVAALREFDIKALQSLEPSLIEKAGECGLRSIWIMIGALDGIQVESEVLSYEGPFGVGYCIARFTPREKKANPFDGLSGESHETNTNSEDKEDPYVKLARNTLEMYVKEGRIPKLPTDLPKEMYSTKAGVFVTIKKQGRLRGCIGTFQPTKENIAKEIQRNAISAGTEDPRFSPVKPTELPELVYSVDVLTKPEPIVSIDELDPKKYGVIVKKDYRSGLLLPALEGVDTVEEQLNIVLEKAGIRSNEPYEIKRFEVIRHI